MNCDLSVLASELHKKVEEINQAKSLVSEILTKFENEKKEHEQMVEMLKIFSINQSDIVHFNVGGQIFATIHSTINKRIQRVNSNDPNDFYEPNLLQSLTSGLADVKRDKNEAFFIDRDPKCFQSILNYLRAANTDEEFDLPENKTELRGLLKEASYYKLQGLIDLANQQLSTKFESSILTKDLVKDLIILCDFKDIKLNLLYRGSRDGFSANNFHVKCDGSSNTLTVIKSTQGNIFGGYTTLAWDQSSSYKNDPACFLFSLVNKENTPLKLRCKDETYSTYCMAAYGPTFGGGHDLHISSDANTNEHSYSNLGHSFVHPQHANGSSQAQSFLAGSFYFRVSEIEVIALQN
jgi:hypothetical protein